MVPLCFCPALYSDKTGGGGHAPPLAVHVPPALNGFIRFRHDSIGQPTISVSHTRRQSSFGKSTSAKLGIQFKGGMIWITSENTGKLQISKSPKQMFQKHLS